MTSKYYSWKPKYDLACWDDHEKDQKVGQRKSVARSPQKITACQPTNLPDAKCHKCPRKKRDSERGRRERLVDRTRLRLT